MRIRKIQYTSKFKRRFKKLPKDIQHKAIKREKLFRKNPLNTKLRTHKLKEKLKNYHSFSIDTPYRIVFSLEVQKTVTFIDVGNHSIYK